MIYFYFNSLPVLGKMNYEQIPFIYKTNAPGEALPAISIALPGRKMIQK